MPLRIWQVILFLQERHRLLKTLWKGAAFEHVRFSQYLKRNLSR